MSNDKNNFRDFAKGFLKKNICVYHNGALYRYTGKCYRFEDEPKVSIRQWFASQNVKTTTNTVNNVYEEIKAIAIQQRPMPFWIGSEIKHTDNYIPFDNGLLSLDSWLRGEPILTDHTCTFVNDWVLPFKFNPTATCEKWLAFLADVFSGDPERAALLQEWFGYCLLPDTRFQKFIMFLGQPRSGKGTIASILKELVGVDNSCAFDLFRLAERFAMASLVKARLAVVGEVEIGKSTDNKKIVERLKSVVGNDPQVIERKGIDIQPSMLIKTKFTLCSNKMPLLYDDSGALEERMLLLTFDKTFAGREDYDLLDKLKTELEGITIWAMHGLQRLLEKGWTKPEAANQEKHSFKRSSSTPLAFLQDCCVIDKKWITPFVCGVETADGPLEIDSKKLHLVYDLWAWQEDVTGSYAWLCRNVRALLPHFFPEQVRVNGEIARVFYGLSLNELGSHLLFKCKR